VLDSSVTFLPWIPKKQLITMLPHRNVEQIIFPIGKVSRLTASGPEVPFRQYPLSMWILLDFRRKRLTNSRSESSDMPLSQQIS